MKKRFILILFIALILLGSVGCSSHPPTMSREEFKFYNDSNKRKTALLKKEYKEYFDGVLAQIKEDGSIPENINEIKEKLKVYSETIDTNISKIKEYDCSDDLKDYQDLLIDYYELEKEYLQLISDVVISRTKEYSQEEVDDILSKRDDIDLLVSNKSVEIFHNKIKDY